MVEAAILDRIAKLVAQASGIHVRPTARWLLAARVEARARAGGDRDARAYLARLEGEKGVAELGALIEAIRVGETRFFRHGAQLQALRRVVIPEIRARAVAGDRRVRAWSAGCSTGEEAYTLAMLLDEEMPRGRGFEVSVLATDISEEALTLAAQGRYEAEAVRPVPDELRARYFVAEGSGATWRVAPALQGLVRFERRNLLDRTYPNGFDLVLCRNVLIYFGPLGRDEVIRRLAWSLKPGGFLFLGYSETLQAFEEEFEVIATEGGTLYRRPPATFEMPHVEAEPIPAAPVSSSVAVPLRVLVARGDYDGTDRRLARELAPLLEADAPIVTVDLDGASFLADEVARDLRRALKLLSQQGRRLVVVAERPGVRRWLDRVGLSSEVTVVTRAAD